MFTSVLGLIPLIFFGIPLLFVFGLFISGAFTLFFTPETDKGKDVIARALTYFLILLAIFLVFIVVSYVVKKGEVFNPAEEGTELPLSPIGAFPAAPDFTVVGDYSFSGPWPLSQADVTDETYVFGIFCKKNQGYDIIDLGISYKNKAISSSNNYQCWQEQCQSPDNIYVGFYWTDPKEPYLDRESFSEIKKDFDFVCNPNL
jgi:hypothetical protein